MADDKDVTGFGGPEAAKPETAPANVVTDNSGEVPVQPIATTDPTLDDNTNPKVPFDGGDPRNIPPHDSNEQLHLAASKRINALGGSPLSDGARRKAVAAAYDNDKDVREVVEAESDDDKTVETEVDAAERRRAAAQSGSRVQPPKNRTPMRPGSTKA